VKATLQLAIAYRSLTPAVVLRRKIGHEFMSLSSLQKGKDEQALDYG
jgi:hypothetical protein